METRFKLRLSRIFQSSFVSCRSRYLSDIIHKPVFVPSEPAQTVASSRHLLLPQRKISRRFSFAPFPSAVPGGRTCPLASPISPFPENVTHEKISTTNKKKKKKQRKQRKKESPFCQFSSLSLESNFGGTWWYSCEDEDEDDETDTIFSSKSRSSDSSTSHRRYKSRRRRGGRSRSSEMGVLPLTEKVKDSFAVVKKSSDPYNDFRCSMLEMIVEKQIFSGKDLEQLLQCFLSLNSHHHHNVILEVFTEIWEALFSDWGS
ncbi:transcription repressor OFP8-like [Cucurbita pepo subsp. pepo]|uniref:transcription repressor OFP8-like n=1 Tax=Cucurbita pepo subsp. pepo TaxID=3664 RepID=UPI000C9DA66A|nr:transcription repressor OFP8-like [Cucurbita pepo subsp. pepo]